MNKKFTALSSIFLSTLLAGEIRGESDKKTAEITAGTNAALLALVGVGAIAAKKINDNTVQQKLFEEYGKGEDAGRDLKNKEIRELANYKARDVLKNNPAIDTKSFQFHPLTPAERNNTEFMNRYKEIFTYKREHPEIDPEKINIQFKE